MQIAIIGSLILSILHSVLFFRKNVGISVLLFTIPAVLFLIYVLDKKGKIKNKKALFLSIPIFLLSSTYFIFNNSFFNVLNIFAILALLASMIIWAISDEFKFSLLLSKIFNIILGPIEFIGQSFRIIRENLFNTSKKDENSKINITKKVIKAILISLPILLVVLFLLMSADDNFAQIFSFVSDYIIKLFTSLEFLYLVLRLLLIFVLFIYFVSFLYNLLEEKSSFNVLDKIKSPKKFKFDIFTVNTVLTVLNIIYFIFSAVQIGSLFSNNSMAIEQYSNSARQGFFQLMIVSAINFVLIIISTINRTNESEKSKLYKKIMNILIIIFTMVILLVSFQRMNLYKDTYGYTLLRLLVFSALATEALLIIPTILYVLKGKINLFQSYFVIIVVMYVIINFVNFDKIIAKENINRYIEKGKLDFSYLMQDTGTDAIPEIKKLYLNKDNLESKDGDTQALNRKINNYLYDMKKDLEEEKDTWQSFNISRKNARDELADLDLKYENSNYKNYEYRYDYNNL